VGAHFIDPHFFIPNGMTSSAQAIAVSAVPDVLHGALDPAHNHADREICYRAFDIRVLEYCRPLQFFHLLSFLRWHDHVELEIKHDLLLNGFSGQEFFYIAADEC
jgi:hypothetical protein